MIHVVELSVKSFRYDSRELILSVKLSVKSFRYATSLVIKENK
jgi:hypothetical protein